MLFGDVLKVYKQMKGHTMFVNLKIQYPRQTGLQFPYNFNENHNSFCLFIFWKLGQTN